MIREVVVIGAGPAGAASAALLARAGHRVTLLDGARFDAEGRLLGHAPLCGEFLSPDLLARLSELGWLEPCLRAGAIEIKAARLFVGSRELRIELPAPGLGLSRARLDAILRREAVAQGVELCEGAITVGASREGDAVRVALRDSALLASNLVLATGKKTPRAEGAGGSLGGRLHLRMRDLVTEVELHFFSGGYVGLAPIEDGRVNLCGLFERRLSARAFRAGRLDLEWLATRSSALSARLEKVTAVEDDAASVSGLRFGARGPLEEAGFRVGDAAGMIAPLAGSGLAMAVESATLLSRAFRQVSEEARRAEYARAWHRSFEPRLRRSVLLQRALLLPVPRAALLLAARAWPVIGQSLFRATRGPLESATAREEVHAR